MQTPFSHELPPKSSPVAQPISPLPFLTANLPGIEGRLKECSRDFEVEEIPAYLPGGEGEHLFLWIEKEDVAAEQLTQHIARTLGISSSEVGVAGMKDRRAVTRQYVSVPAHCEEFVPDLGTDCIRVLEAKRHGNKLRTGHLKGNRFSILVRAVHPDALLRANDIGQMIRRMGFPKFRPAAVRSLKEKRCRWAGCWGISDRATFPDIAGSSAPACAHHPFNQRLFDEILTKWPTG
jgi:tRNA(Glu) U13 pseudouridine synthase TruD